jgi:hypothetical protein
LTPTFAPIIVGWSLKPVRLVIAYVSLLWAARRRRSPIPPARAGERLFSEPFRTVA